MSDTDKEMEQAQLEATRQKADLLGVPWTKQQKESTILRNIAAHEAAMTGQDEPEEVVETVADTIELKITQDPASLPRDKDGFVDLTQLPHTYDKMGRVQYSPIIRMALKRDAERLVRISITCMNPAKKEWKGEIIAIQNAVLGAVKKFVPYNTAAADAYHVPHAIYQALVQREFQAFSEVTVKGQKMKKPRQVREFNVAVLEPLTQAEIDAIAKKQRMDEAED